MEPREGGAGRKGEIYTETGRRNSETKEQKERKKAEEKERTRERNDRLADRHKQQMGKTKMKVKGGEYELEKGRERVIEQRKLIKE
jgi:hypothetical protein